MPEPSAPSRILVVADRHCAGELVAAVSELHNVEVVVSSGGDDTIEVFETRRPTVVVLTASLLLGDTRSLIVTLRGMVPRGEVAIVVVGDDAGPIRTALDALDLAPDRFVTRPLSPKALRFAVRGGIDAVRLVRSSPAVSVPAHPATAEPGPARIVREEPAGAPAPLARPASSSSGPGAGAARAMVAAPLAGWGEDPAGSAAGAVSQARGGIGEAAASSSTRAALRARWEALADSIVDTPDDADPAASDDEPAPLPPPLVIKPRRRNTDPFDDGGWSPDAADDVPVREPTLIIRDPAPVATAAAVTAAAFAARPASPPATMLPALAPASPAAPGQAALLAPMPAPALTPIPALVPSRLSTLAPLPALAPSAALMPALAPAAVLAPARRAPDLLVADGEAEPAASRTRTGDGQVVVAARTSSDELWSEPMPIAALVDRDPRLEANGPAGPARDDLGIPLDELADELLGHDTERRSSATSDRLGGIPDQPDARQSGPIIAVSESRDFARELRAKMSMMAQRLFHGGDAPVIPADHAPRHDHHTEIDLASLGDDPPLGGGVTEIEARAASRSEPRDPTTSPGSPGGWDTQVRERGLPDTGGIVRGVSDAAMLLAKMFAQGATGRVGFRRDDIETVVYLDQGRPVFASSNEPRDRMGELLLREGKITASQYERCQVVVAESGRRMGEILVDFGYLKRRELLPAVRRHVEDLVYSLFGWDRGTYYVALDPQPSAERIRLSRHPAALVLEGIRRKFDRTSLERLIGPPATVIEVRDRDRLGGIVNLGDLAAEERAALAAFDGQADLAQVARTAGVDLADVLPLAWGLCVLGLATARRTDTELPEESTALVGETDLAIDRERVRARWQLVTEADYFALLGVRRDATGFEIRRAYQSARRDFAAECFPADLRRELARELDDIAHVLDEAFRVLRDDRLRQTYLANLIDA